MLCFKSLFEVPYHLWLGLMDRVNFERRQHISDIKIDEFSFEEDSDSNGLTKR